MTSHPAHEGLRPWVIWGCGTLFFLFQFVLRVSPGVMVHDLMTTFHVDAATVGSLGAAAYTAYSLAQIPAGLLLDQWGVRRTLLLMMLLCIAGCLGFAWAPDVFWARWARFLIGLGSAGGFLGCAKIVHLWFPPRRTGLVVGLTVAVGTLGAIGGGEPLARVIQASGWRQAMVGMACAGACLAVPVACLVRAPEDHEPRTSLPGVRTLRGMVHGVWGRLRVVLLVPEAWYSACAGVGVYMVLSVLADMWGTTFLHQVYGLPVDEAAGVMSVTYAGFLFGALLGPWGSDHLKSRRGPLAGGLICAGVVWGLLFFVPDVLTVGRIRFLLFLAGMAAGGQIVALSVMADLVPKSHVAMATAFANMIVMLAGSVLQYTAGCVLDRFWDGTLSSAGTRLYSCETFQKAVGSMVVWMGLGLFAVWRMKETHPLHEPSEGDSPA